MDSNESIIANVEDNYILIRIYLFKESFSRIEKIPFGDGLIETNVALSNVKSEINENKFSITTSIEIVGRMNDEAEKKEIFKLETSFVGNFTIEGKPELPFDDFCDINAPAIIFPFIREHIASISYKAGMPQLILPTLSFKKLSS